MNATDFEDRLYSLGACLEARRRFHTEGVGTWRDAWELCAKIGKSDWMIWFVLKAGVGQDPIRQGETVTSLQRRRLVALWNLAESRRNYHQLTEMKHLALRAYVSGQRLPSAATVGMPSPIFYLMYYPECLLIHEAGGYAIPIASGWSTRDVLRYVPRPIMNDGFDE